MTKVTINIHTCTPAMYLRRTYTDMTQEEAVEAFLEQANEIVYGMKVYVRISEGEDAGDYYGIVKSPNVNYEGTYGLIVCDPDNWREPTGLSINFDKDEVRTIYF